MTPLELDEYLDHNDVEINDETLLIAHHGILGMKWGHLNGPPYPLGRGDHSASEKKAASKAGIKVGTDSGKGSIENIKRVEQQFQDLEHHQRKNPNQKLQKSMKLKDKQPLNLEAEFK